MILGITRDPGFGPMLIVGLGGIHVEVLKDVAFAPVPLGPDEAAASAS
jgi:acyl-CoA synthetase (NDP forming)